MPGHRSQVQLHWQVLCNVGDSPCMTTTTEGSEDSMTAEAMQ